jgi:formate hydrogenlyase subunit 6/NADH:ubiquinone oxidoreductase subunit I
MVQKKVKTGQEVILDPQGLQALLDLLKNKGFRVVGPTVRSNAVVYDELEDISGLPFGLKGVQEAGRYSLADDGTRSLFGYVPGSQSWKKFLHPSSVRLWQARREGSGFMISGEPDDAPKYAFIGVRACELGAIALHDKVFNNGRFRDPVYQMRREKAFIVAVNCVIPGGTCFCTSMGTGPKASTGFDIALTEMIDMQGHRLLAEAGTRKGSGILEKTPHREATEEEKAKARGLLERAADRMGRTLDVSGLEKLFQDHFEDPAWEDVADRCLTCGNCTMVCPTCFCTNVEEVNTLNGNRAERWRKWDSCFSKEFSYIHGGSIRFSEKARYRQWLTHKFGTWVEQFGTIGCVGCGRCITWCPVGIDVTEELNALLKSRPA